MRQQNLRRAYGVVWCGMDGTDGVEGLTQTDWPRRRRTGQKGKKSQEWVVYCYDALLARRGGEQRPFPSACVGSERVSHEVGWLWLFGRTDRFVVVVVLVAVAAGGSVVDVVAATGVVGETETCADTHAEKGMASGTISTQSPGLISGPREVLEKERVTGQGLPIGRFAGKARLASSPRLTTPPTFQTRCAIAGPYAE
ncbi:uncharacterized protein FOMMEDRAFT_26191 [Fomitiporia mediterranea MF3/22]|uniref:uncharacterized protein n=1 Tax=Fomitiporia mediterranea (strain MF3/22) TaxID=694068 RepID=UPI0004407ECC|nr:uncharacterized protein FOMMEDRAFT_26191 [Fomitiporia mediterranea MF3/22]EJD07083.1 hypothetical protein FOMMEDRAFT_26191 [Fomitiporia mediterranea MF3/22]